MTALLQLVSPHVPSGAMTVAMNQGAPRVFSPAFLDRLAQLTHAERELRALGLRVVWSRLSEPRPQAHIRRDAAVSIAPLLERMGPRSFREESGCKLVSGEFEGVIVSWVEPS